MSEENWTEKWKKFQEREKPPELSSDNGDGYGSKTSPAIEFSSLASGAANIARSQTLEDAGDTPLSCDMDYYTSILENLGFEKVLVDELEVNDLYDDGKKRKEEVQIWARPDGLIMTVDTFGDSRNGASMSFVFEPDDDKNCYSLGASGGVREISGKKYFSGFKDMREGLRSSLADMEGKGSFLNNWPEEMGQAESMYEGFSLVCEQDYSHQREQLGMPKYDETPEQRDEMHAAVDEVDKRRKEELPLWVRQMAGTEPIDASTTPQISHGGGSKPGI